MEGHILKPLFNNGGLYFECKYCDLQTNKEKHPNDDAHIHNFYELYMNIDGDVSFAVENRKYDISSGDLILTRNNEFHYCIYNSDSIHKFFCLWIFADESFEYLLKPFSDCINNNGNHIHLSNSKKEEFCRLLSSVVKCYDTDNSVSVESLNGIVSLLCSLKSIKSNHNQGNAIPKRLKEILDYIDDNYMGDCSVENICKRFFVSRSTLNRLFSVCLFTSPKNYIQNRRLSNAKRLLDSKKSVQETYELCGFSDYSHFIQVFKKRFGITPKKYSNSSPDRKSTEE